MLKTDLSNFYKRNNLRQYLPRQPPTPFRYGVYVSPALTQQTYAFAPSTAFKPAGIYQGSRFKQMKAIKITDASPQLEDTAEHHSTEKPVGRSTRGRAQFRGPVREAHNTTAKRQHAGRCHNGPQVWTDCLKRAPACYLEGDNDSLFSTKCDKLLGQMRDMNFSSTTLRHQCRISVFTAVTMKNGVFWDIKTQFVLHRRHITSPL
jgi:hypothetical protein